MINWRRTGKNEYPQVGQICLIYFYYTKFSISEYSFEVDPILGNCHMFHDEGGFLTGEDLLWIPVQELELEKIENVENIYECFELPDDYLNDKRFMKWDNPNKVINVIQLNKDVTIDILDRKYDFKKGELFGKISECFGQIICVRREEHTTSQYYFSKDDVDDVNIKYEDIKEVTNGCNI